LITTDINKAIQQLNRNELVAIPTETVYGLAANAFSSLAVEKIFKLKQRPFYNPLIVHVKSMNDLETIACDIPSSALKLATSFWPGPLTLVLKKQQHIPTIVTADKDTVAIRMPNHPMALSLLSQLEFPLAAPSANPFGSISPTNAEHVLNYFGDDLEVILDGGECEMGIESTIIGFEENQPILYRLGTITLKEIEEVVGVVKMKTTNDVNPEAPGMILRHYAPKTKTLLTDDLLDCISQHHGMKIGVIKFSGELTYTTIDQLEILSPNGSLNEAAKKLYASMHRLDQCNLDLIIMERFPDEGLGKTINDKLLRATYTL
jgi:L-threonylcarbamoyladenylate synthase